MLAYSAVEAMLYPQPGEYDSTAHGVFEGNHEVNPNAVAERRLRVPPRDAVAILDRMVANGRFVAYAG